MRKLKADTFARQRLPGGQRRWSGALIFVFALVSVALLVLSRIDHPLVRTVQVQIEALFAPVLQVMAVPLSPLRRFNEQIAIYTRAAEEVERVRDENLQLKGWEARARELERRLADLAALARVVDQPALEFVTGRVLADARGPFARSVLANFGQDHGVKNGYPVISRDGLVGRVLETGTRSSRVLLLNDLNSRVPVLIGNDGARGILMGDNSAKPRLGHLSDGIELGAGLEVVTSGVGGLYPRGLRVGTLERGDNGWRVAPHARLDQLDYVSVLFHVTPELEIVGEVPKGEARDAARRRAAARRAAQSTSEQQ